MKTFKRSLVAFGVVALVGLWFGSSKAKAQLSISIGSGVYPVAPAPVVVPPPVYAVPPPVVVAPRLPKPYPYRGYPRYRAPYRGPGYGYGYGHGPHGGRGYPVGRAPSHGHGGPRPHR